MTENENLTFESLFFKIFSSLMDDYVQLCKSLEDHQKKAEQPEIEVDISMLNLDGTIPDDKKQPDPYGAPRAIFWVAWSELKMECYKRRIYLDEETVEKFFKKNVPYSYVWKKLVIGDEDFSTFNKMRINDELEKRYKTADSAEQRAKIIIQEKIRSILNTCFERSKRPAQDDRLAKPFNEELIMVIGQLEKEKLKIDVNQLKALITRVLPSTFPAYLLKLADQYEERLSLIIPKPFVEKAAELLPVEEEIVDLVELIEEPLEVSEPTIDTETGQLIMAKNRYFIGITGLQQTMKDLMSIDTYGPMDYKNKLKSFLDKVKIYCRDHGKLAGLIKVIHELEKHYEKLHMENYTKKIKNDMSMKIAFTYTTLQLLHASLAENMAPSFVGGRITIK